MKPRTGMTSGDEGDDGACGAWQACLTGSVARGAKASGPVLTRCCCHTAKCHLLVPWRRPASAHTRGELPGFVSLVAGFSYYQDQWPTAGRGSSALFC